jgi:hypothetical protein
MLVLTQLLVYGGMFCHTGWYEGGVLGQGLDKSAYTVCRGRSPTR